MEHLSRQQRKCKQLVHLLLASCLAGVTVVHAEFRDEREERSRPMKVTGEQGVVPSQSVVAAPMPRWSLDSRKTLKENLDAWTKEAGWNPIVWEADNYYRVRLDTDSIEGYFPEVLRQISTSTGLNICAFRRDRYIRVTDRGISCKELNK